MGDTALDLLKALKYSRDDVLSPSFEDEKVKKIFAECNALYQDVQDRLKESTKDPEIVCGAIVHHHTLLRNKRCVLTYLNERAKCLEDLRWRTGKIPAEYASSLSKEEQDYFHNYGKLLVNYFSSISPPLSLTADQDPPKNLFIEVRVLEDCGRITTTSGKEIQLIKDQTVFLRKVDAEPLIREGILAVLKS